MAKNPTQRRKGAENAKFYNLLTTRFIPSFSTGTLKLINKPNFLFIKRKQESN